MAGHGHDDDGEAGRVGASETHAGRHAPEPLAAADQSSRRDFLKLGGIAAAGLVVGGGVGAGAGAAVGHALGYREGSADLGVGTI
ncbi:twin-arginine translocation signal domain-containing protein [Microbacterium atlanticum]|uniref:twin-arginine translocation signal domain-containing protein n=1 Tax=Microbacterium atlanticum TaxID=2782168 RepID=UPI001E32870F|nr:twin-arginine translocation signal domain-containing protein [Microbacterium atlanticum]